ncbi:MAG TPA: ferritin [Balneolaceae bacterium]|nr:ferritin [Balneolaceae bacterium]
MIKQKLQDEVNDQIQAEFQSGWLYLAFAAWFEEKNLEGFSNWMRQQWREEQDHGMRFYNHILRRDGQVELKDLEKPSFSADSPADIFEQALEHERYITKRIHQLYDLAEKEGDYPLKTLLHWFIDEQVEEEENVSAILDRLNLIGEDGGSLYLLDRELGDRSAAGNGANDGNAADAQ